MAALRSRQARRYMPCQMSNTDTTQTAQRCVTQRQRLREVSVHVDTVFDTIDTPPRCGDLSDDAKAWRDRPQRPELGPVAIDLAPSRIDSLTVVRVHPQASPDCIAGSDTRERD
ncbi:hypothetical protein HETIRDRAFT_454003 [Heterobasidion irregulare TC 32-1]|uniref:Uncharacterized protein n=1 Tax=Heterobasidion irregulare (strain TC 32-1) TaxID=747525 RepID=W4JYH9_HETIT|nr:uncharacterized protein HETIRDRAFT_454003 [Heterobasidion irregulare TC 32-1]ETW77916.1 hypothetical protein HETIRDRAFT_454003 [Heterobasidion irregulare TC 32-1]